MSFLGDEMRQQKLSDSRKIEQLECQIDEHEARQFETMRSQPRIVQNRSDSIDFSPSQMFGESTTENKKICVQFRTVIINTHTNTKKRFST